MFARASGVLIRFRVVVASQAVTPEYALNGQGVGRERGARRATHLWFID